MVIDKSFGELLQDSREKKNVTLDVLGAGLCDAGKLSRIENGKVEAEKLLRERLLARLGVAAENYENFLYYSEYKDWRERQDIVYSILHHNLEEAKQRLERYHDGHSMEQPLEYQFYLSMLVQIRRMEDANQEEQRELFRQALELTIPKEAVTGPIKLLLSVEELNLLLEYAFYSEEEFSTAWYEMLFSYVEGLGLDKLSLAKIYPKLVFYYCRKWKLEEADREVLGRLLRFCNKAIEVLQKGNRMFYMWELLRIKEQVLQALIIQNEDKGEMAVKQLKEWQQTCVNWYTTLAEVYEEYGVVKKMQDFCYIYLDMEAFCIGDVIRIRRKMFGMTMLQLSDGICSERTVSRLERNETEPHREIVRELFVRLNMSAEFCKRELITGSPEAIRMFGEVKRSSNKWDYDTAEMLLEQIKAKVSLEIPENRQAIQRSELVIEKGRKKENKEEMDSRQLIIRLKEILSNTIPYEVAVAPGEKYLTQNELSCLQNIINSVDWSCQEMGQCVSAMYQLFEEQRKAEECFDMYEFVMGTVASEFGNKRRYDLSDEIGVKILKKALEYRQIRGLAGQVYELLWNDEQRRKEKHPVKRDADINKELIKCIRLSEISDNMHRIPFYARKLEENMK